MSESVKEGMQKKMEEGRTAERTAERNEGSSSLMRQARLEAGGTDQTVARITITRCTAVILEPVAC